MPTKPPPRYNQHRLRTLPESQVASRRLGRHVHFDERSRDYPVTRLLGPRAAIREKTWERRLPALDQGSIGSCTGHAAAGLLATAPLSRPRVTGTTALNIYKRASRLDPFPGQYTPTDKGSTVLAAMQALVKMRLIRRYHWCFGLQDVLRALAELGPVEVGVNWYEGFDEPDSRGRVHVAGESRGGHAFELLGVDPAQRTVTAINSWGPGWGRDGRFTFSWDDLDRLLHEEGEACAIRTA